MNAEAMNEHPSCVLDFSKGAVANRFSMKKRPYSGSLLL